MEDSGRIMSEADDNSAASAGEHGNSIPTVQNISQEGGANAQSKSCRSLVDNATLVLFRRKKFGDPSGIMGATGITVEYNLQQNMPCWGFSLLSSLYQLCEIASRCGGLPQHKPIL